MTYYFATFLSCSGTTFEKIRLWSVRYRIWKFIREICLRYKILLVYNICPKISFEYQNQFKQLSFLQYKSVLHNERGSFWTTNKLPKIRVSLHFFFSSLISFNTHDLSVIFFHQFPSKLFILTYSISVRQLSCSHS